LGSIFLVKDPVRTAILSYRIAAGIGMVLLAVVWAGGWFIPGDVFENTQSPGVLIGLVAAVFAAWNLLAAVIATGFFHAASHYTAKTYGAYRSASFRLVILGLLVLFVVPLAALVLGTSPIGRALSLAITGISICAIIFGRARLRVIESRLISYAAEDRSTLVPIEEVEQLGETGP
jgi:hypothetical protein